jgi:septum formation protein
MTKPMICLGSASPRRVELLAQIGVAFEVATANVDEEPQLGEAPEVYVLRMALEKAEAVLAQNPGLPVLAADTTVVVEGEILGKPRDEADGLGMLERLSGRAHQVLTAVALAEAGDERRRATRLNVNKVVFRSTTAAERLAYWRTGEPLDKAGGYGIQGHAAVFIEHLEGSFSAVMGLPLFETAELLAEFGINVYDNWCDNGGEGA